MNYAYFPGCSLHATAKEFDRSTKAVCDALKIGLQEIPEWNCCGSTPAHATNEKLAHALSMNNLVWPEVKGLDLVTPCASCYNRLKITNNAVKGSSPLLKEINEVIGKEYQGKANVKHLLEVMPGPEVIREKMKLSLEGLKVVCYYGCLLSRPKAVSTEEDFENPTEMDALMDACGAEVVPWGFKTVCCGASAALTNTDVVLKLSTAIINEAHLAGADCVVVACPMCHSNLDMRQADLGMDFRVPVLYFTQLLGLALGMKKNKLGLNMHFVDPSPVLGEKELV